MSCIILYHVAVDGKYIRSGPSQAAPGGRGSQRGWREVARSRYQTTSSRNSYLGAICQERRICVVTRLARLSRRSYKESRPACGTGLGRKGMLMGATSGLPPQCSLLPRTWWRCVAATTAAPNNRRENDLDNLDVHRLTLPTGPAQAMPRQATRPVTPSGGANQVCGTEVFAKTILVDL